MLTQPIKVWLWIPCIINDPSKASLAIANHQHIKKQFAWHNCLNLESPKELNIREVQIAVPSSPVQKHLNIASQPQVKCFLAINCLLPSGPIAKLTMIICTSASCAQKTISRFQMDRRYRCQNINSYLNGSEYYLCSNCTHPRRCALRNSPSLLLKYSKEVYSLSHLPIYNCYGLCSHTKTHVPRRNIVRSQKHDICKFAVLIVETMRQSVSIQDNTRSTTQL